MVFEKDTLNKLKHRASDLFDRTLDANVNLAVTGLSRSGKTAFITSLVNQLLNAGYSADLPFFDVAQNDQLIGIKRVPQKHLHVPRFNYEGAIGAFSNDNIDWPEPTKGISQLRLALKYRPASSLMKLAKDDVTLTIDITDYPGEWLLDLPLMSMTFEEWSEFSSELFESTIRADYAKDFMDKLAQLDPLAQVNEDELAQLAQEYTDLLLIFKNELGLSVIQPGRFVLPGELAGAPVLQFFPYLNINDLDKNKYQNAGDDTVIGMLKARFTEYKQRIVKQFYKEHFVNFDRQIILADCLTPLRHGEQSFKELRTAIDMIMESFNYGQSSLLKRMFSPRIDKLMFAATKADHVTPEQHKPLVSLLNQLVYSKMQSLNFEHVEMKSIALSSVKVTDLGQSNHKGKSIPVIQGVREDDRKLVTMFPGTVPAKLPDSEFWQKNTFNFTTFLPKTRLIEGEALPHLRMDQVLQFLLGDKIR